MLTLYDRRALASGGVRRGSGHRSRTGSTVRPSARSSRGGPRIRASPMLHASAVADDSWAVAIADERSREVDDGAHLPRRRPAHRRRRRLPRATRPRTDRLQRYARAKLEADALERLPSLASLIVDRHHDQTLIDPGPRRAAQAASAVLLPTITHRTETTVTPLRPATR